LKVCAVIVTYGDRFHLLKQVIDACFREGVDKVIVVDNASVENSRNQLKEFESKNKDKLKVIYLNENTGSAGGFKRGLETTYHDPECEFIWLLDDDNEPQKDSLKVLKEYWNSLEDENKEEKTALLSYRPDRIQYKEAIMTNNPNLVLGRKNSFLGFHVIDLPKKIVRVIKRKLGLSTFRENPNIKNGKVAVAPYGGMFFHKNLINTIGYPKEEFFVYADDHEWSYRIIKNGGKIYLLLDSLIEDIDTSWNVSKNKRSFQIIAEGNNFRMYYGVRNRVFFEKTNLVSNKLIYKLNMFIFGFLVKWNDKTGKNYKIFKKAVYDGIKGRLGINENINV
jgi:GT2 family glycosyltransferase